MGHLNFDSLTGLFMTGLLTVFSLSSLLMGGLGLVDLGSNIVLCLAILLVTILGALKHSRPITC